MLTKTFFDSIGVNIHPNYTDSQYGSEALTASSLRAAGINKVRAACLSATQQGQAHYAQLAAAGVSFSMIVGGNIGGAIGLLEEFVKEFPGSVDYIEGPNEPNNNRRAFPTDSSAIAFQASLYGAVKASPILAKVPVVGMCSYPNIASRCDYAQTHPYPTTYAAMSNIDHAVQETRLLMPTAGQIVGEIGIRTGGTKTAVTPELQAKMLFTCIMESLSLGVSRVYLYQLFDAYPDPQNNKAENHWGIFDLNYHPRPFVALLSQLRAILGKSASTPEVSVSAKVLGGKGFVLQRGAGRYAVIVWNCSPNAEVNVDLGFKANSVVAYDPSLGAAPHQTLGDVRSFSLTLTGAPLVVTFQR